MATIMPALTEYNYYEITIGYKNLPFIFGLFCVNLTTEARESKTQCPHPKALK